MLHVDDLDARNAALDEQPIEFCRDAAGSVVDSCAMGRHRQHEVWIRSAFATDLGAAGPGYDQHKAAVCRRYGPFGGAQHILIEAAAEAVLRAEHDQSGFFWAHRSFDRAVGWQQTC